MQCELGSGEYPRRESYFKSFEGFNCFNKGKLRAASGLCPLPGCLCWSEVAV